MRYLVATSASGLALVILFFGGTAGPFTITAQPPSTKPEVNPKVLGFMKPVEIVAGDGELLKKQKERHNVAVKLLEVRVTEYKVGRSDIGPVFEATRLTAEAKMDLAETAEAKVAALELVLEVARLIESTLQQQIEKGFGSRADVERARYARLTVEIELMRAKKDGPRQK